MGDGEGKKEGKALTCDEGKKKEGEERKRGKEGAFIGGGGTRTITPTRDGPQRSLS